MSALKHTSDSRFPLLAVALLVMLLLTGLGIAVTSEQALKHQLAREAEAQADLLASAVSGALAFDDQQAAQDYVDAVQVNPNVIAAAVYDDNNRVIASFARPGEIVPPVATPRGRTTTFQGGRLYVVRPVVQGGQTLGTARLRLLDMPSSQRFSRYAGLLLVLGLSILVVIVLVVAQGALRRVNRELKRRADELAETNLILGQQMKEREKAEEALRQSQKMEAIGRLTGGIAHDFNNLLMVASSGIELLDRTEDPRKRKALSEGVRQAVERGAALTRQMLAFSRRSPLRSDILELPRQVEGLRFLLERSLREDISVTFDLPSDMWRVEADAGEFELALLNLAVNARDAMPSGGHLSISGRNEAGHDPEPDWVLLQVADTGIGMSEAVAARVFEPFFTTKEVGRGTGLGLSQVYGFARSSGGGVTVHSIEGQGTVFTLRLPRSDKLPGVAVLPRADGPSQATNPTGGGRILLVEDDDAVAAGVGHMLRDLGYTYVRAAQAADGLALLQTGQQVDLVFSDMVMPGEIDGLSLAKTVRDRHPNLPVILTTGYSEAAAAAAAERFPLLLKPYSLNQLAETLVDLMPRNAVARPGDDT